MPVTLDGKIITESGQETGQTVDLNTGVVSGVQNIPATQVTTPNNNLATPIAPAVPKIGDPIPDGGGLRYEQGDITNLAAPTASTTQPTKPLPQTLSVVDLLNAAGQSSDFASRTQLAKQFGIQGYTGTADQNITLGKKFRELYESKKTTAVPESGADARSAISTGLQTQPDQDVIDPTKQFQRLKMSL